MQTIAELENRIKAIQDYLDDRFRFNGKIIAMKNACHLTNKDLSPVLGFSPSTTANKIAGWYPLNSDERMTLENFLIAECMKQGIDPNSFSDKP